MCSASNESGGGVSLLSLVLENAQQDTPHNKKKKQHKKRVRFSNVEIREYSLTVGDHPMCEDGLALSLDWSYVPETTVKNIVDVEKEKESSTGSDCCSSPLSSPSSPPKRLGYLDRKLRLQQASSEKDEYEKFLEKEQAKADDEMQRYRYLSPLSIIDLDESSPDAHVRILPSQ